MNPLHKHSVGVHLSIKGSFLYLFEQAEALDIKTFACFTASNLKYEFTHHIDPTIRAEFLKIKKEKNYQIFAHACYLINIAQKNNTEIYDKSIKALDAELRRCNQLDITGVAFHPGSNPHRQLGLESIIDTINQLEILKTGQTRLLIESSAGQGNTLPTSLEEIAFLNNNISPEIKDRVKFVFDTCHIFAAGYDLSSPSAIDFVLEKYDALIGLGRIALIHLNDSKHSSGSLKDRHETLGKGYIGEEGLAYFINHSQIKNIPKILETPVKSYQDWRPELEWIKEKLYL